MKRTGLIVTALFVFFSYAGLSQKDCDYNPYQHGREEYIQTCLELMKERENFDCEEAREAIKFYQKTLMYVQETNEERDIWSIIGLISSFQCPESFDFVVELMNNDTSSEPIRCGAIVSLGTKRDIKCLPILLDYADRKPLSIDEKSSLAWAFKTIGIYNDRPDLIRKAVEILDKICYEQSSVLDECIWNYYSIGGEVAIKFFDYYFELKNPKLLWAALRLSELGMYDKTYPIFVEAIDSGEEGSIHIALYGLAAIGTEEAFTLIKEQTKSQNEFIAREAKWIFEYIEMKRREKCKG
jgi:tetratricopeptide (TPR) repeat protein